MTTIKSLAATAKELKEKGLSDMEIANELHLSTDTVVWLLTHETDRKEPPTDIRIGWRSIGIYPHRIRFAAEVMTDIIEEELEKRARDIDTVCAIAINGIPFATFIAESMGVELLVYKPHPEGKTGAFSSNYASLENKHVVLVDDVVGTGQTLATAIKALKEHGSTTELVMVLVNKTPRDDIEGVPLRALIRAISMQEIQ